MLAIKKIKECLGCPQSQTSRSVGPRTGNVVYVEGQIVEASPDWTTRLRKKETGCSSYVKLKRLAQDRDQRINIANLWQP